MKRTSLRTRFSVASLLALILSLALLPASAADNTDWKVKLQVAESCSCVVSVEQVPLKFEHDNSRTSYSAPSSRVEMRIKKDPNGKPITIQNTGLSDYVQYVSVTNSHRSDTLQFACSGTSAATWTLEAKSK